MKLIEKELQKSKTAQHELKEVKQLLDNCHSEDIAIMRGLSKNSEINILERNRGHRLELERLDNSWNGQVYSIGNIKNLCIDYRLRFLSSQLYKGKFDTQLVQLVKQFAEDNKITLTDYLLQTKFFILAPPEMFSLEEAKYISKKQLDPVLFYKIDENSFKKIHAWGSDFTIFRKVLGWKWKNAFNEFVFNTAIIFCVCILLISFILPTEVFNYWISYGIINLILSMIISRLINHTDEWEQIDDFFTPHNWNNKSKLKY